MTLENFIKGAKTGAASLVDIVGWGVNYVDHSLTGVGTASKRAIPTFSATVHQNVYADYAQDLSIAKGYVPRCLGELTGMLGAGVGLAGLYSINPLAAIIAPAVFGTSAIIQGIVRYGRDFILGEKIGDQNEKATFMDGLTFGYESTTYIGILPSLEADLTGRGYAESHLKNNITKSAKPMRRNFSAVMGSVIGGLAGLTASVCTLGILPMYKSIRDYSQQRRAQRSNQNQTQATS